MNNSQALLLSLFTFLTVIAWIAFDIYHFSTVSTLSPVQLELIKPLNPTFDTQVFIDLKK